MKTKWTDLQIKDFFDFVAENLKNNVSMLDIFKKYGIKTQKNALYLRNFYYQQLKVFNQNKQISQKLNIDLSVFKVQNFKHFSKHQEMELKNKIDNMLQKGYSVRKACAMLSDGNIKQMLRLQNKYNKIKKSNNTNSINTHTNKILFAKTNTNQYQSCQIINFPTMQNKLKKQTLNDEEIKALFMGLVKLVKENAKENNSQNMQLFLEQTEMQKRREIVLLKQKQTEIDNLNKKIADLQQKNRVLNEKLTDYRIHFLNNFKD